jgi:hypothetical protein
VETIHEVAEEFGDILAVDLGEAYGNVCGVVRPLHHFLR